MNNIDWQDMLVKGRRRTRIQRIVGILTLAALLGFFLWHFFYASTPEYALNKLNAAIQNNDSDEIKKYCNLDAICSKAYDDLTRDMFAHDSNLTNETKVMFEKFYLNIKPQVIDETSNMILAYMLSGEWPTPSGNNIMKGRQLGIDYEYLIERSQLRNTELVRFDHFTKSGNEAIAKIQVRDKYTDTIYGLNLLMVKHEGTWQVTEIRNYRDYLDFLGPIQETGLKNYIHDTSKIIEKYNSIFDTQQTHFKKLNKSDDGVLTAKMRSNIVAYIRSDIIPALEKRQSELDAVAINEGAQYLAAQRKESTKLTIAAWEHFITALETDSPDEFNISEGFHKDALFYDHRIDDMIRNTAISRELPSTP